MLRISEIKPCVLFILSLIVLSCQEVYEPENLDSSKKIPVIDGKITNGHGPFLVKVHWLSPFNSGIHEPVKNASVTIIENKVNIFQLHEESMGRYESYENEFCVMPGNEYVLNIELDNGEVYASEPVKVPEEPEIDLLYAKMGNYNNVNKNIYGEIIIQEEEGLYFYTDLLNLTDSGKYYRFETRVNAQTTYYRNPSSPFPVSVYCWSVVNLNRMPAIKQGIYDGQYFQIKNKELGFVGYHVDYTFRTDTSSAKRPAGWIVSLTAYEIQPEAFQFYDLVNKQLNADNNIFDPIPSQINGNMKCLTDTSKLVLGLFEVSSHKTIHKAFYWATGAEQYLSKELPEYNGPMAGFGCQDTVPPDFWFYLYEFYSK